jgi:hypothetical protein
MQTIAAQASGCKGQRRDDATVLTFRQLDRLAGVLDAIGLPGTAAAIAGKLAQAGDEVVLRFGTKAYAVRRARP